MDKPSPSRRTTVEYTTPLWRVLSVILAAGAVAALGYYLQEVGHAGDFATIIVIATGFTISFWAHGGHCEAARRWRACGAGASAHG